MNVFKVNPFIEGVGLQFLESPHLLTTQALLWVQDQQLLHQVLSHLIKAVRKLVLQFGYLLEYLILMSEKYTSGTIILFHTKLSSFISKYRLCHFYVIIKGSYKIYPNNQQIFSWPQTFYKNNNLTGGDDTVSENLKLSRDYWLTYPPLKGGSPDISWYTIQPNAHRSELFQTENKDHHMKNWNWWQTFLYQFSIIIVYNVLYWIFPTANQIQWEVHI